ncbi:hypothetical protein BD626DRAFT_575760 [Schizophyllum amplum]|uniref:Uncharacterized protein n=1 Tax=Schizophyllum amplum TaxID=97359 RepID=A0A550BUY6_9AGAR|nr:hypothetical protein BD626DRAFT_575760 [Auriculariopsis ampla]
MSTSQFPVPSPAQQTSGLLSPQLHASPSQLPVVSRSDMTAAPPTSPERPIPMTPVRSTGVASSVPPASFWVASINARLPESHATPDVGPTRDANQGRGSSMARRNMGPRPKAEVLQGPSAAGLPATVKTSNMSIFIVIVPCNGQVNHAFRTIYTPATLASRIPSYQANHLTCHATFASHNHLPLFLAIDNALRTHAKKVGITIPPNDSPDGTDSYELSSWVIYKPTLVSSSRKTDVVKDDRFRLEPHPDVRTSNFSMQLLRRNGSVGLPNPPVAPKKGTKSLTPFTVFIGPRGQTRFTAPLTTISRYTAPADVYQPSQEHACWPERCHRMLWPETNPSHPLSCILYLCPSTLTRPRSESLDNMVSQPLTSRPRLLSPPPFSEALYSDDLPDIIEPPLSTTHASTAVNFSHHAEAPSSSSSAHVTSSSHDALPQIGSSDLDLLTPANEYEEEQQMQAALERSINGDSESNNLPPAPSARPSSAVLRTYGRSTTRSSLTTQSSRRAPEPFPDLDAQMLPPSLDGASSQGALVEDFQRRVIKAVRHALDYSGEVISIHGTSVHAIADYLISLVTYLILPNQPLPSTRPDITRARPDAKDMKLIHLLQDKNLHFNFFVRSARHSSSSSSLGLGPVNAVFGEIADRVLSNDLYFLDAAEDSGRASRCLSDGTTTDERIRQQSVNGALLAICLVQLGGSPRLAQPTLAALVLNHALLKLTVNQLTLLAPKMQPVYKGLIHFKPGDTLDPNLRMRIDYHLDDGLDAIPTQPDQAWVDRILPGVLLRHMNKRLNERHHFDEREFAALHRSFNIPIAEKHFVNLFGTVEDTLRLIPALIDRTVKDPLTEILPHLRVRPADSQKENDVVVRFSHILKSRIDQHLLIPGHPAGTEEFVGAQAFEDGRESIAARSTIFLEGARETSMLPLGAWTSNFIVHPAFTGIEGRHIVSFL